MARLIGPSGTKTNPTTTTPTTTGNPFIDQMATTFNTSATTFPHQPLPIMSLTLDGSATFLATGNPCLDLFFKASSSNLSSLLFDSWDHNPLTTLKLIANLRGVRGSGKSDKATFYSAAIWLHNHHPKTMALNLSTFADFGYFKDLPEILFKLLGLSRPGKTRRTFRRRKPFQNNKSKKKNKNKKKFYKGIPREVRVKQAAARQEREKLDAAVLRHRKRADLAKKALQRFNRDPDYRFLHERVSDLFAEKLKSDLEFLKQGKGNMISLAAKWCPSLDSSFDRGTLLCEAIARKVFPKEECEEYREIEEGHYAYRVRDRLRKEVLVPLRKALELPEVFMSKREWGEVRYNRVASVAMRTYQEMFMSHDGERFNEYLDKVKEGKAKIAAGALLPHEIVINALSSGGDVAELQWKRMLADVSECGKMSNCIAVCDVSRTMHGAPMEVSVSLGLLLAELAEEPWKGKVITFSDNPQLHFIQGDNLISKTHSIRTMEAGTKADIQRVFDLILWVAVQGKLSPDQMIKRVFVFSAMEFDKASCRPWKTDFKEIKKKFEKMGFEGCVPEIVFWNLKPSRSIPVNKDEKGVALVSGFSKNMVKMFLKGGVEQLDPQAIMEEAISGEEYNKLVVVD